MSCIYCDLQVGNTYNLLDVNVNCDGCGNSIYWDSIEVKYKYKNKGEHYFKVVQPYNCQECNTNVNRIIAPCGGSYYFNESDVSESLLLPQEFIVRK